MNLILFGNTGSGKSTLAKILADKHGFIHVNTGEITRMMHRFGCHNLPILVQAMIETMDKKNNHVFDHFYKHTYKQLAYLFGKPVVIKVVDRRQHKSLPDINKAVRYISQYTDIEDFLSKQDAEIYTVYNTDYGFDVSELIRADILPFNSFAVEMVNE